MGAADDDGDDDDGDDGGGGGSGGGGGTATRACTPVEVTPAQSLRELALIRELTLTIGVPCDESAVPSESAAQEQQDSLATARARIQLLEKELLVALEAGPMKKAQIKAEIKAEVKAEIEAEIQMIQAITRAETDAASANAAAAAEGLRRAADVAPDSALEERMHALQQQLDAKLHDWQHEAHLELVTKLERRLGEQIATELTTRQLHNEGGAERTSAQHACAHHGAERTNTQHACAHHGAERTNAFSERSHVAPGESSHVASRGHSVPAYHPDYQRESLLPPGMPRLKVSEAALADAISAAADAEAAAAAEASRADASQEALSEVRNELQVLQNAYESVLQRLIDQTEQRQRADEYSVAEGDTVVEEEEDEEEEEEEEEAQPAYVEDQLPSSMDVPATAPEDQLPSSMDAKPDGARDGARERPQRRDGRNAEAARRVLLAHRAASYGPSLAGSVVVGAGAVAVTSLPGAVNVNLIHTSLPTGALPGAAPEPPDAPGTALSSTLVEWLDTWRLAGRAAGSSSGGGGDGGGVEGVAASSEVAASSGYSEPPPMSFGGYSFFPEVSDLDAVLDGCASVRANCGQRESKWGDELNADAVSTRCVPETALTPETARTSVPASAVPGRASGDEGSEWPSLTDYLPLSSTLFDPSEGPSRGAEMPATAPERRGLQGRSEDDRPRRRSLDGRTSDELLPTAQVPSEWLRLFSASFEWPSLADYVDVSGAPSPADAPDAASDAASAAAPVSATEPMSVSEWPSFSVILPTFSSRLELWARQLDEHWLGASGEADVPATAPDVPATAPGAPATAPASTGWLGSPRAAATGDAAPPAAAPDVASDVPAAKAMAREGHTLNEKADYGGARDAFHEAYRTCPQGAEFAKEKANLLFSAANMALKANDVLGAKVRYDELLRLASLEDGLAALRAKVHVKLADARFSAIQTSASGRMYILE